MPFKRKKRRKTKECTVFKLGFLDTDHYNSASLENYYYNSSILKHAIIIIGLSESCHFLRIPAALGPLTRMRMQSAYRRQFVYGVKSSGPIRQSHRHYNGPAIGGG